MTRDSALLAVSLAIFSIALTGFSDTAVAQSCESVTNGAMDTDENGNPAHRIYIYAENDMHNELRQSTPSSQDDNLTQAQLLGSISSMIDIWNTTTRSVSLVFAGTTNADTPVEFCTAVSKRPAVFLHFDEKSVGTGAWYKSSIIDCPNEELAHVYYEGGGGNFYLGSQAAATSTGNFETILIHELGHVVGLADLEDSLCDTHTNAHSVMNACPNKPTIANGRWFPLSWDKDCADAFSWGRAVNYRWRGWTSTGSAGLTELGSATYGRGTFTGGYVRTDSGAARYALYGDNKLRSGPIGSDGNINWPTTSYFDSTEISRGIEDLDVTPLLVSLHEYSASADPMRIAFLDDEYDGFPSTKYNPPLVETIETDADLDPIAGNDTPLIRCNDSACTSAPNVRSHLPISAAWDPISNRTIIIWVETYSEGGGADAEGTMWIHPGFESHDKLRAGTELTLSILNPPSSSTSWDWTGQTLHSPGVACSDGTYPFGTYNCILAWTDRGQADASGNTLIWTYFKVNSNGTFTFYPASYTQSTFQAASSPAVAWFGDQFWLAFRKFGVSSSGIRVFTKTAGGDWDYSSFTSAADAIDAPTFLYRDGYESAAAWTETE